MCLTWKGSLLQAILRELPPTAGNINVCGRIAYTSQEPSIFAGSIRQNILFGRAFDAVWYDKVLEACALKKDLKLFPYRDLTVVGDRGKSSHYTYTIRYPMTMVLSFSISQALH